jgi:hypothetical protein
MTNDKLLELYRSNIEGMRQVAEEGPEYQDGPHLMYCWDEFFEKANCKLLLVGKEGCTPTGRTEDIITLKSNGYADFRLSTNPNNPNWRYKRPTTPYWRALWELSDTLNPELAGKPCFLQTNTSKYSYDGLPINFEDHRFNVQYLNLLPGEIKAAAPDAVVFFSGPGYDEWLQLQFNGQLLFTSAVDAIPVRELARVEHKGGGLPVHTYRTYHPRYLERNKDNVSRWNYIQLIASLIKGVNVSALIARLADEGKALAAKHGLELLDSPPLVKNYSGFYFSKPLWKHIAIGFEFESYGADELFYGVRRKELERPLPDEVLKRIKERLGECDESTEYWPWWAWFQEPMRNPIQGDLELIANERLIEEMEKKLLVLLNRLEGAEF